MPNPDTPPDHSIRHMLFPEEASAEQERKAHAAWVLAMFDTLEHRDILERRSIRVEIERKARSQL